MEPSGLLVIVALVVVGLLTLVVLFSICWRTTLMGILTHLHKGDTLTVRHWDEGNLINSTRDHAFLSGIHLRVQYTRDDTGKNVWESCRVTQIGKPGDVMLRFIGGRLVLIDDEVVDGPPLLRQDRETLEKLLLDVRQAVQTV